MARCHLCGKNITDDNKRYFSKRLVHITCLDKIAETTPIEIRKTPVKVRHFGKQRSWKSPEHKITNSPQYNEMRKESLRILDEADNWVCNTTMCWELNNNLDLELLPRQVTFLLSTIRKKEGFTILTKRSSNPYENRQRKGALDQHGSKSSYSTFPIVRTFHRLVRESCLSCGSNNVKPILETSNWVCLSCNFIYPTLPNPNLQKV